MVIPSDTRTLALSLAACVRNIVAHDYGHVDVVLVWKAATEKIPPIRRLLGDFLGNT